jgi:hypothetical protein
MKTGFPFTSTLLWMLPPVLATISVLPDDCRGMSDFDYLMLTSILMTPHEDGLPDLIHALFFTHEMASEQTTDDFLDIAAKIGLAIADETTPLDLAMRIWIADREALERKHSQQHITNTRTFEHYQAVCPKRSLLRLT